MASSEPVMPALISPALGARIQRLENILLRIEELKKLREEEKEERYEILKEMTSTKTPLIKVGVKNYAYRKKKRTVNPKRDELQKRFRGALISAHKGALNEDEAQSIIKEIYSPVEVNEVYVLTINDPSKRKAKSGQISADNDGENFEDPEDDGDEQQQQDDDYDQEESIPQPPPKKRSRSRK